MHGAKSEVFHNLRVRGSKRYGSTHLKPRAQRSSGSIVLFVPFRRVYGFKRTGRCSVLTLAFLRI